MGAFDLLENVSDETTFLRFVDELVKDRMASVKAEATVPSSPSDPTAGGWENTTIESFLEAAVAWARTTEFGETQNLKGANLWRVFATFLYVGKIYE